MLIVGVNGSPHKNGDTVFMLNTLADEVKKLGADFEMVHVIDAFSDVKNPFCFGCKQGIDCDAHCYLGTKMEEAFAVMDKADAIVLASPVYYGGATGLLKCFFDKTLRVRLDRRWMGKIGTAMSVGGAKNGGQEFALHAMQNMMLVHGMAVIADGSFESGCGHYGVMAQRPASEDEKAKTRIKVLAERLVHFQK